MEKENIKDIARRLNTVEDLSKLLTQIKEDEFSTTKYPISKKQLLHFCNPKIVPNRYKTFQIRKKSGGLREINAPTYQLGIILHTLNILLKAIYSPSESVMGFTEGRSIKDNASVHVGHNYVFNIDLKDFFPSIPQARVWKRLQLPPFSFTQEIANVVAGLCCNYDKEKGENVIPQGAATSPLLTNAICDKLDYLMRGVAKRFGLHYTRYADDMTFSSMHNVYQKDGEFRTELIRIIEEQGFTINDKKTRLLKNGDRQEVTGLTVNSIVNVTRKYIKDIRFILHIWEKYGYGVAYSVFYPKYKKEKGYIKKGEPVMENVIGGKLCYLKMIKGEHNVACSKLIERFNNLQQMVYADTETDMGQNYIYVQPYTISDFEKYFNANISLEISPKQKLVGKCTICEMDKTIAISKSTQALYCSNISEHTIGEKIESEALAQSFITLCRCKGKNFWLITHKEPKRSKCLSLQNAKIDVDFLLACWEEQGIECAINMFKMMIEGTLDTSNLKIETLAKESEKKQSTNPSHGKIVYERFDRMDQLLEEMQGVELPEDVEEW